MPRTPPPEYTWRKGQSGNKEGRPLGSKNLKTLIKLASREMVVVEVDGKRKKISKLELVLKQLMTKAAQGQPRFTQMALDQVRLAEDADARQAPGALNEADELVIAQIVARIRRNKAGDMDDES
jgi:hypothetical protein